MSECHRTKILLKGIMVFKTKGPQVRCIPHGSFGLSECKSSSKKKHAGRQNLKTWINSKKGPQIRCIPRGRWGLAQYKSTCEEHAGSDISSTRSSQQRFHEIAHAHSWSIFVLASPFWQGWSVSTSQSGVYLHHRKVIFLIYHTSAIFAKQSL